MDLQSAGLKEKSNRANWMNGGRRPTTAPSSTRSGWKDDKISESRSSISKWEIRYSSLFPRLRLFSLVSLESKWEGLCLVNPPGQWREYIPRARTTGTQRNRRLWVFRARAPVYGHRQTLNVPYPSLEQWAQVYFSSFVSVAPSYVWKKIKLK